MSHKIIRRFTHKGFVEKRSNIIGPSLPFQVRSLSWISRILYCRQSSEGQRKINIDAGAYVMYEEG
jgi:hypothetical protein